MQAAKTLASLHIYTGSPKHPFLRTAISAKNKCAGSFDLFFVLLVIIYLAWLKIYKGLMGCNFVSMIILSFGMLNTNPYIKYHF